MLFILACTAGGLDADVDAKSTGTSLTVPLIDAEAFRALSEHNDAIVAAGLPALPDAFVVDQDTNREAIRAVRTRIDEALLEAQLPLEALWGSSLEGFLSATKDGLATPLCYAGSAEAAASRLLPMLQDSVLGASFETVHWRTSDDEGWGPAGEDPAVATEADAIEVGVGEILVVSATGAGAFAIDMVGPCPGADLLDVLGGDEIPPGALQITEIGVNPPGNALGQEWIEIVNTTDTTLDLYGLELSDATGKAGQILRTLLVEPRSLVLIGQVATDVQVMESYGASPVLDDAGATLTLKMGAVVLDETTFGAVADGQSVQRSSTDPLAWCTGAPSPAVASAQCL